MSKCQHEPHSMEPGKADNQDVEVPTAKAWVRWIYLHNKLVIMIIYVTATMDDSQGEYF